MIKKFSDLLNESWIEYKANFKMILKVFTLLAVIPALILFFYIGIDYSNGSIRIESFEQIKNLGAIALSSMIILSLIANILSVLMKGTFISAFFSEKATKKASDAIKEGLNYLPGLIGLAVVMIAALIPLYILLIIPGVIFTIYWAFSAYILIGENKGIIESLKASFNLVKGKWWKVFGYLLLILLVLICISVLIMIPGFIILKLIELIISKNIMYDLTSEIINLGIALITTPLLTIFMKNFYLELKSGKVKGKKWKTKTKR